MWWAGPVIGAINLIPVLPLDGGHATTTVLDRFIPGRADSVMTYASVAVTVAALVATPFVDRLRGMTVFIGFLLLIQLQGLFAHRADTARSPIDAAVAALADGDRGRADRILRKAFAQRAPLLRTPQRGARRRQGDRSSATSSPTSVNRSRGGSRRTSTC